MVEPFRKYFYGDFDARRGLDYFTDQSQLATFFYQVLHAIGNHKFLTFSYLPQTDLTRQRIESRRQHFPSIDVQKIPVRLMPRYIVASGISFLILGESYIKRLLTKDSYGPPRCRQYEMRGIIDLHVMEEGKSQLKIIPKELYQNSIQVWVGGIEHELVFEEIHSVADGAKRRIRKINGEDEVLALIASSLGKVRIVNPPQPLIERAKQIGLPVELIFRLDGS